LVIGGLAHETNTFSPVATTLAAFRQRSYLTGEAIVRQSRSGRSVFGGIVDAAEAAGATLLPTLFASAPPAGLVTRDAAASLIGALLERLRAYQSAPWPIDGVVLALHGAMVSDGIADVDGALLTEICALIGPDLPVVVVLDSHANVTRMMVSAVDLLLCYDTYPHLDPYERGQEAVHRCLDQIDGRIQPTSAFRRLPLLIPLVAQRTDSETPMAEVIRLVHALEADPDVIAIAVAGGFPYADIAASGVTVTVTVDNDANRARDLTNQIAAFLWERRDRFVPTCLAPDAALDLALAQLSGRPVILADVADNPGAGAPGDGTWILSRLLDRGVRQTVIGALPDPTVVTTAIAAGVDATIRVALGGKSDARGGPPLDVTARVLAVSDGVFANLGPMGHGGTTRLGRTATLAIDGVTVIVCERSVQTADPGVFAVAGVDLADVRVVVVKSGVHFRAAFAGLAQTMIEVEAGGLSSSDLRSFPYRQLSRPILPLDPGVTTFD